MAVAVARLSRHLTEHRDASRGAGFAKRPRSPAHREDLLREAAVYDVVRARCPAVADRLPRDAHWSPDADELRMEALPAETLADHVEASGTLDPVVAAAVGSVVGALHAEVADLGPDAPLSDWLRGGVGIARPTPGRLRLLSAGGITLLKVLQYSGGLQARLSGLAPPANDALVHGDLRWENILVQGGAEASVWLIDWEMGGSGERAWDAGCFAAACVSEWLCSIPAIPGVSPERLVAEAGLPMDALSPGLGAFWTAYGEAVPDVRTDAWARRCTQLAAVRLVYAGFECTTFDADLQPAAVAHLQVAAHVLQDPLRAAHELLGMP